MHMRHLTSKLLLVIFIIQIIAQIALLTSVVPFTTLFGIKEQNSDSTKNNSPVNPIKLSLDQNSNSVYTNGKSGNTATSTVDSNSNAKTNTEKTNNNQASAITNSISSIQGLTSSPSDPIFLYKANATGSNSLNIDIGQSGNSRLVVIFASVESTSATLTGSVSVGTAYANLIYKAQVVDATGNHLELWAISEYGLGSLSGVQTISLGSGSDSTWGMSAMVFYGVYDSAVSSSTHDVYPYDIQYNVTSFATNTVTVNNVNIPKSGLAIFGSGNGINSTYDSAGWNSIDGLTPSISMTQTNDTRLSSAELGQAYYVLPSTYPNSTNRQMKATTTEPDAWRISGIVATFQANNTHTVHTSTIEPSSDRAYYTNLYTSGYCGFYGCSDAYRVTDSSSPSSYYVYATTSSRYDDFYLSSASIADSSITKVTVYTQGQLRGVGTGTMLTELGTNFGSRVSGHSGIISSSTSTWDTFQNVFYTNPAGQQWQWGDISPLTIRLTLYNFSVTKVWIDIEYALHPSATGVSLSPSSNVKTTDALFANYQYVSADSIPDDTSVSPQILWYKDSVLQPTLNNSLTVEPGNTSKNENWYFEIRVSDGLYYSSWYTSNTISVLDSAPVVTSASITPSNATTTDTLVAAYTYIDADNDPLTYNITWYNNTILVPSLNNATTVPSTYTAKGELWTYEVQLFDGEQYSQTLTGTLSYGVILNSIPFVGNVTLGPTVTYSNGSLSLNYNKSDADPVDTLTPTILWFKNNQLQKSLNDSTSLDASYLIRGDIWNVSVQVYDGYNYSSIAWSNAISIRNTPTVLSGIQVLPGIAYTADTLYANFTRFDIDGDGLVSYNITWYKNGYPVFYNTTQINYGNTTHFENWSFSVMIFDGFNNSLIYYSPNITIANSLPTLSNVVINDGSANQPQNTQLNANYTYYDADGDVNDTLKVYIIWTVKYSNGSILHPYENQTFVPASAVTLSSLYWFYSVQVFDGYNYSILYTSPSVGVGAVANTPPTVSNVVLSFVSVNSTNSQLFVNYTYYDNEGDPQSGTIIYWYKNGNLIVQYTCLGISMPDATCQYLPASYTIKNDQWYAVVQPRDGIDYGSNYPSNTIVIGNTLPTASNVLINPSNPTTSQDLTLTYTWSDADSPIDHNSGTMIHWFLNGAYNTTFDNWTTIPSTYTMKNQIWWVIVYPSDGNGSVGIGVWMNGNITIINSAPTVSNVVLSPNNPYTINNLTVTYTYYDIDHVDNSSVDTQNGSLIVWYLNGNAQHQFDNNLTIYFGYTNKTQNWYYIVYPSDNGTIYTSGYKSNTIFVQNSKPTIITSTITINGQTKPIVYSNGSLLLNYKYSDADNDIEYGTIIVWYKNGNMQGGLNNSKSVSANYLFTGDIWYVVITPKDGSTYGIAYNSSSYGVRVKIRNTAPEVTSISLTPSNPTTSSTLLLSYSYYDYDGTPEVTALMQVRWYLNGTYNSTFDNLLSINPIFTHKGQTWYANISVSDGSNSSSWRWTATITIFNSIPTLSNVVITPTVATSSQNLTASFTPNDADGDQISIYELYWVKSNITGSFVMGQFNFTTVINSSYIILNDQWYFVIVISDGTNQSIQYQSQVITIGDTAPIISSLLFGSTQVRSNGSITIIVGASDPDNTQPILRIYWYRNGNLVTALNNLQTVPSSYLVYGDMWNVTVVPFDGILYGQNMTIGGLVILNTPPTVSNVKFIDGQYPYFYISNENLTVLYTYYDKDQPIGQNNISWYQNNHLVVSLNGSLIVPSSMTKAGDTWTVSITGFDGINYGNTINLSIIIESKPQINQYGVLNTTDSSGVTSSEGMYTIWLNGTDSRNTITETKIVIFVTKYNLTKTYLLASDNGTKDLYSQKIELLKLLESNGYSDSEYKNLIGLTLIIYVEVTTDVNYNNQIQSISSSLIFNIIIKDNAPPRVDSASYQWNNPNTPTNITFYASVVDYGSNITSVTLYYYFRNTSTTQSATTGTAKINANYPYTVVQMTKINATTYAYTVSYSPTVETDVLFDIGVVDSSGNSNQNAFPLGTSDSMVKAGRFIPSNFGISPEMVIGIILAVLLIALVFTFVAIKKFRSTELVGLDKDLILNKINSLRNDNEIATQLDLHTLGIIVSFFDQRHGPIPIIVTPEILQDNYNLLVNLSDMSFSSARFSGNFENEMFSTYNFEPAQGQFINIVSFGYALDRPSARGGAENITLNILIHKNVSELLNQFIDKLQIKIHEIHILMDKRPDEKDQIFQKIKELRLFMSKIVITYEKLYGTTELLDSYDQIFDN